MDLIFKVFHPLKIIPTQLLTRIIWCLCMVQMGLLKLFTLHNISWFFKTCKTIIHKYQKGCKCKVNKIVCWKIICCQTPSCRILRIHLGITKLTKKFGEEELTLVRDKDSDLPNLLWLVRQLPQICRTWQKSRLKINSRFQLQWPKISHNWGHKEWLTMQTLIKWVQEFQLVTHHHMTSINTTQISRCINHLCAVHLIRKDKANIAQTRKLTITTTNSILKMHCWYLHLNH